MIVAVPNLLSFEQVKQAHENFSQAAWQDGTATAGHIAVKVKRNQQLAVTDPVALHWGQVITAALTQHPLCVSASLPLHVLPPMFNRYEGGEHYGTHVDGAIRVIPGSGNKIRTDVSCTVFFSEPDEYDGGELIIEDTYGSKSVKLPAGHAILYPATSLHRVTPVTRGARVSSFFWMQSMVRDAQQRSLLFDLDCAIQHLTADHPDHASLVTMSGIYHNLLRQWSDL
jgi:PKHD-type hydroxylase